MIADKKTIFSWCIYDLANTAYSALFVTFFFPVLMKVFLGGNEFQIGLVMGISMGIAALLVPFIGAISDVTKKRMPFIIIFTIISTIFIALTGFASLFWAMVFAIIANLSFHAAIDVYDAKLIDISNAKNRGRISGYGTALGYVGTILSLGMAFLILQIFGPNSKLAIQLIFPATAIFFLGFSLITFFNVKDKVKKVTIAKIKIIKNAAHSLKHTIVNINRYKGLLPFLLASFFYADGANTAIIFLFLYGREQIGITIAQFFPLFALMALVSGLGALLFGKINDKIGAKKSITITLFLWMAIIILLLAVTNFTTFMIAGLIGGVALGATWTITRPMLVTLAPKEKIAELFGFQGLTEKLSGVVGPIIFGYVVIRSGYQPALSVLLIFFLIALFLLFFIPDKR